MVLSKRLAMLGVTGGLVAAIAGCGVAVPSNIVQYSASTNTVTLNLIGGYHMNNGFNNFDGYANGRMTITIPAGAKVKINYVNKSGTPNSIGVYNSNHQLAFAHSGPSWSSVIQNTAYGVQPGQKKTYTFTASTVGQYRLESLLWQKIGGNKTTSTTPNHSSYGMWVHFNVVNGAKPSVSVN